ncbi:MAG TPA: SRPBCC family protein [Armatimonadota bacterium]|nr:SRPBCC family protein [Armatimonadota bacterium]
MPRFTRSVEISAPIDQVFEFHTNPRNIIRVAPPGSHTELVSASDETLKPGSRVIVRSTQAGIPVRIEAEVTRIEAPNLLQDRQVSGPFAHWIHTHRFEKTPGGARLIDEIDYELPMGPLGSFLMGRLVARELRETFAYRQEQTRRLLENPVRVEKNDPA